jgi:hypothetical protein
MIMKFEVFRGRLACCLRDLIMELTEGTIRQMRWEFGLGNMGNLGSGPNNDGFRFVIG